MNLFRYQAYNKEGLKVEGVMEAAHPGIVKMGLKGEGLVPIRIVRESESPSITRLLKLHRKIGLSQIEFFSSEISILLRNGVKIDRALEIVRNGTEEENFKEVIETIYKDVRKGIALSESLGNRTDIFDPLFVSVVAIGEKTGKLAEAFVDLEQALKFRKQISSRITQAIFYPAFILIFCILTLLLIFNFIIPRFGVLFDSVENIPFYTRLLLDMSTFIRSYQLFLFIAALAGGYLLVRARHTEAWKKVFDFASYRLPGMSNLILSLENLRFSSALRILLRNNVVIDEALGYAVDAVGNRHLKRKIRSLQNDIKKGKELSEILSKSQFFTPSFISLIEVGEHSGNLGEIFSELEDRFRIQFESRVIQFTSLLEPLLILVMGVIVGSIVIMLLLSIVSIQDIRI